MRWNWTDDGWRRRFAIFPLYFSDGQHRRVVWLERYWSRDNSLYIEVALDDPRRDRDASLAEDAKRLSGEAVAARASEGGIAQPPQD